MKLYLLYLLIATIALLARLGERQNAGTETNELSA